MLVENNNEVIIASTYSHARTIEEEIVEAARQSNFGDEAVFALRLSLEEALTNAIHHGNADDSGKKIQVSYSVTPQAVKVRIADEGPGFNPEQVPDPTTEERLEVPSGRGILLMRAYMDQVEFNEQGNEVILIKYAQDATGKTETLHGGNLKLTNEIHDEHAVLKLSGSADMAEAQALGAFLAEQLTQGRKSLLLEISGVSFISSMGLGALIQAHNQCRKAGGSLLVVAPQPAVRRVLYTTRLDRFFELFDTLDEAKARMGRSTT